MQCLDALPQDDITLHTLEESKDNGEHVSATSTESKRRRVSADESVDGQISAGLASATGHASLLPIAMDPASQASSFFYKCCTGLACDQKDHRFCIHLSVEEMVATAGGLSVQQLTMAHPVNRFGMFKLQGSDLPPVNSGLGIENMANDGMHVDESELTKGSTLLSMACRWGQLELCSSLLRRAVQLDRLMPYNCGSSNATTVQQLLSPKGYDFSPLEMAISKGHRRIVQLLRTYVSHMTTRHLCM